MNIKGADIDLTAPNVEILFASNIPDLKVFRKKTSVLIYHFHIHSYSESHNRTSTSITDTTYYKLTVNVDKTQQFSKVWHILSTLDVRDPKIVCNIKATKRLREKRSNLYVLLVIENKHTKMSVLADDLLLSKQI